MKNQRDVIYATLGSTHLSIALKRPAFAHASVPTNGKAATRPPTRVRCAERTFDGHLLARSRETTTSLIAVWNVGIATRAEEDASGNERRPAEGEDDKA